MSYEEYLLTKLAEECCEVAQRATKAQCFGLAEVQPGQSLNNAERIMDELEDVRVIVEMLREQGALSFGPIDPERFAAKRAKVERYMQYSREQGCLREDAR